MKTIFGEEHFIDREMINIYKLYDKQFTDGVYACATKMGIEVNKRKFEHWLKFCAELEQIDKSDLIDIAIKRKFDEKDHRIAVLERALDLACETIKNVCGNQPLWIAGGALPQAPEFKDADYFIDQAEKELKDENK